MDVARTHLTLILLAAVGKFKGQTVQVFFLSGKCCVLRCFADVTPTLDEDILHLREI